MPDATQYTRLSDENPGLFARWNHGLTRLEKQLIILTTIFGITIFALSIALVNCNAKVHPPTPSNTTTEAPTSTTVSPAPTNSTTVAPTTKSTTIAPNTKSTTVAPTTKSTTVAPTTKSTTVAPTTKSTTVAPTTKSTSPIPTTTPHNSTDQLIETNSETPKETNEKDPDAYQPILKVQESKTEEATTHSSK